MTLVAFILIAPWIGVLGLAGWVAYKKWEQYAA